MPARERAEPPPRKKTPAPAKKKAAKKAPRAPRPAPAKTAQPKPRPAPKPRVRKVRDDYPETVRAVIRRADPDFRRQLAEELYPPPPPPLRKRADLPLGVEAAREALDASRKQADLRYWREAYRAELRAAGYSKASIASYLGAAKRRHNIRREAATLARLATIGSLDASKEAHRYTLKENMRERSGQWEAFHDYVEEQLGLDEGEIVDLWFSPDV